MRVPFYHCRENNIIFLTAIYGETLDNPRKGREERKENSWDEISSSGSDVLLKYTSSRGLDLVSIWMECHQEILGSGIDWEVLKKIFLKRCQSLSYSSQDNIWDESWKSTGIMTLSFLIASSSIIYRYILIALYESHF